ncbi:RDD family protein [Promicromonospora sp. Populi]|uniref:RDD family protein n=1 Tax=Promicromonospora sp. Populi TaxID=3239420 RepID=UPI0034E2F33C
MQQTAARAAAGRGGSGSVPIVESHPPITTEVEVYTATQIPKSGTVPPPLAAPYAGVGKRFLAWLIDGVVGGVLAGIVMGIGSLFIERPSGTVVPSQEQTAEMLGQFFVVYLIAGFVAFGYWLAMWIWEGRTGRTVGNAAMGLRTVSVEDREPIGFGRVILRVLVLAAGAVVLGIGQLVVLLSPLWDKGDKVQGWQDKAARSVVIDTRAPRIMMSTGLAPVAPGPRAPGLPALRPAAPSFGQPGSAQLPSRAPVGPQAPVQAPVAAPDPWAFPQSPAPAAAAPTGDGLITGIPGSAPGAPPAGPMQQPVQPVQPVQQQPVQPVQQQPAPAPAQRPESAWPSKTWPAPQEQVAPPVQQPVAPPVQQPVRPELPPQRDELSDATRMQAPVLEPAAVATVVIELESGERRVIDGPALVGRNPQATDGTGVILVRVDDPTRSVSKNHAELGVDSAGLWLTDRGSTNGTVVSAPGRSPQVAEPGARVRVPVGSTVHVGDRRILVHRNETRA